MKRRARMWDMHTTDAQAADAAQAVNDTQIELLRAEVTALRNRLDTAQIDLARLTDQNAALTTERDQTRTVAREMAERLDQWRHLGGGACPLCADGRWYEGEHQHDCPVSMVRAWDK